MSRRIVRWVAPSALVVPLMALGGLAGCGGVEGSEGELPETLRGELGQLIAAARVELAEGRESLSRAFEGEAEERLGRLVAHLEAAATRLGEEQLGELQRLLDEGGLERALDGLEQRGARAWRGLREDLEAGGARLADLIDGWEAELAARAAARETPPAPEGVPDGPRVR